MWFIWIDWKGYLNNDIFRIVHVSVRVVSYDSFVLQNKQHIYIKFSVLGRRIEASIPYGSMLD